MSQPIFDIAHPPEEGAQLGDVLAAIPKAPKRRNFRWLRTCGIIFGALLFCALLAVVLYAASLWNKKEFLERAGKDFYLNATASAEYVRSLEFVKAGDSLRAAKKDLESMRDFDRTYRVSRVAAVLARIAPARYGAASDIRPFLDAVERIVDSGISITDALARVRTDAPRLLFEDDTGALSGLLASVSVQTRQIAGSLPELQGMITRFSQVVPDANLTAPIQEHFIAVDLLLKKMNTFLGSASDFFGSSDERHLLVLFQNPSEMRATGGFMGSYADITFLRGHITKIDVRDIYDPDGQRDEKIIPPKPLQAVTTTWGVRDANWFFDFSESAAKIIELMERSKIYSEQGIKFDGAIAMNTFFIEDLLRDTGPVQMPEYNKEINENNFLTEVQKEVEAGPDKYVRGEPKRILKLLAPRLLERLKSLSDDEMRHVLASVAHRLKNKDIQLYFRDPALESFMRTLGISGNTFETSQNFSGDYLGVVNSNIAGGKTDVVMDQSITLESSIDASGNIKNDLSVIREHTGGTSKYFWYRAVNQNYIRIFSPPGAVLGFAEGFSRKTIPERSVYSRAPYVTDPLVEKSEETRTRVDEYAADVFFEAGKRVFGFWMNVAPAERRELHLEYMLPRHMRVYNGAQYEFILEKQSGVRGSYTVRIKAPPGYIWSQSGTQIFTYIPEEPFARAVVRLTMEARK